MERHGRVARIFKNDKRVIILYKIMNILLIVGSANDIFIYNYAKWMKKSMNCHIDVFEFYPSKRQGYGNEYYENIGSASSCGIPVVRIYIDPYIKARNLSSFLKGKKYDIIHCHWVVAPIVLQSNLKRHCHKLILTFWGGEFLKQKILGSSKLYHYYINHLSKDVDCIINGENGKQELLDLLPHYKGLYKPASLGSAPLESLYELMHTESKTESKKKLDFPTNKFSVLIGYSGKPIHHHIAIIKTMNLYPDLCEQIHIVAPMTRGAADNYISLVENELKGLGISYTIFSGRFLSNIEIARIRNATDIVLQLSEWDGFSRSIIECLCAKSILIYGDWLGYERHLKPNGFDGICVKSIEEGVNKISKIINNMPQYEEMLKNNHESGKTKYMWSECIKDWVNAYNDLLKD